MALTFIEEVASQLNTAVSAQRRWISVREDAPLLREEREQVRHRAQVMGSLDGGNQLPLGLAQAHDQVDTRVAVPEDLRALREHPPIAVPRKLSAYARSPVTLEQLLGGCIHGHADFVRASCAERLQPPATGNA